MKCPACKSKDSKVINSRPIEEGRKIMRRRECQVCNHRFTSYEIIWIENPEPKKYNFTPEIMSAARTIRQKFMALHAGHTVGRGDQRQDEWIAEIIIDELGLQK